MERRQAKERVDVPGAISRPLRSERGDSTRAGRVSAAFLQDRYAQAFPSFGPDLMTGHQGQVEMPMTKIRPALTDHHFTVQMTTDVPSK
jgi:hypothetical protein